jgi:CheY-like chemotaxis protein
MMLVNENKMEISNEETVRILLVDDDEDEKESFLNALRTLNLAHVLYTATSCQELFTTLEQNVLPHVIFMDINMPLPNGLECVKRLKESKQYLDIPVVMYSVSPSGKDIAEAYAAGAHYYIVKPYTSVNLAPTLKVALTPDWRKPQPRADQDAFVINISFSSE